MQICTRALAVRQEQNFYQVTTDAAVIRIYFLTDSIVRIRASFDGKFEECSYSLVRTAWDDLTDSFMQGERQRIECVPAVLTEEISRFVISGRALTVHVEKKPYRICIYDKEGTQLHADIQDLACMKDSNLRVIHTSEIKEDDSFFGFGEKSGEFDKKEKFMIMRPSDAMGYNPIETDSLYKHIPFYIKLSHSTHKACGYFYHNTSECSFDMGRKKSNYWKRHSTFCADSGDIDLFFIAGPSVSRVIEGYTFLTGTSAMLPKYALGYLGSSMYYAELDKDCDKSIISFVDMLKREGIPVDGFQLSSGYCSQQTEQGLKRCVLTWNKERFPDPKAFFAAMNERGVTVSPNVKPGVLLVNPHTQQMHDEGLFIRNAQGTDDAVGAWWGGPGHFADFTSPAGRECWKKLLKENVLECGTSSVWNDNNEYESLFDKDSICELEGRKCTIGHIKSVMSNIMCKITAQAIHETYATERPYIVSRSGHCGIQRYAQTWAGDNLTCYEALKYNIATILGMGLSGVANQGCDIGGFYGIAPEEELFVRWVQNGIFQPRFSIHSVNTDNSVTEPWMYSRSKHLIKEAILLRYRLMPYLYSLMVRAHEQGLPIMEPLFMEFQHDDKCYADGVNFMFGPSLLVANVVDKGDKTKELYLPAGSTFYAQDGYDTAYEGGQNISFPVTLASIPMFLRSGSIVPVADNAQNSLHEDQLTDLRILAVPDCSNTFTLYEDDGHTLNYQQGEYLKTHINMKAGAVTVFEFTREGSYVSPVKRVTVEAVHKGKCPFYVELAGRRLAHFTCRTDFEAAQEGWYYSQSKQATEIKYARPEGNYSLTVSYEKFDMIGM